MKAQINIRKAVELDIPFIVELWKEMMGLKPYLETLYMEA